MRPHDGSRRRNFSGGIGLGSENQVSTRVIAIARYITSSTISGKCFCVGFSFYNNSTAGISKQIFVQNTALRACNGCGYTKINDFKGRFFVWCFHCLYSFPLFYNDRLGNGFAATHTICSNCKCICTSFLYLVYLTIRVVACKARRNSFRIARCQRKDFSTYISIIFANHLNGNGLYIIGRSRNTKCKVTILSCGLRYGNFKNSWLKAFTGFSSKAL